MSASNAADLVAEVAVRMIYAVSDTQAVTHRQGPSANDTYESLLRRSSAPQRQTSAPSPCSQVSGASAQLGVRFCGILHNTPVSVKSGRHGGPCHDAGLDVCAQLSVQLAGSARRRRAAQRPGAGKAAAARRAQVWHTAGTCSVHQQRLAMCVISWRPWRRPSTCSALCSLGALRLLYVAKCRPVSAGTENQRLPNSYSLGSSHPY